MTGKQDKRAARLAEQLRKNLKRRKEQARTRLRPAGDATKDTGGQNQDTPKSRDGICQPETSQPESGCSQKET